MGVQRPLRLHEEADGGLVGITDDFMDRQASITVYSTRIGHKIVSFLRLLLQIFVQCLDVVCAHRAPVRLGHCELDDGPDQIQTCLPAYSA